MLSPLGIYVSYFENWIGVSPVGRTASNIFGLIKYFFIFYGKIIAPQAQFQSAGLGTTAPDDVRVECVWLGRYVLFAALVLRTPAIDRFKIENLACHWTVWAGNRVAKCGRAVCGGCSTGWSAGHTPTFVSRTSLGWSCLDDLWPFCSGISRLVE